MKILFPVTIFGLLISCCDDCDLDLHNAQATFFFINETTATITNDFVDDFEPILPNETKTFVENRVLEQKSRPTVDNYSPSINTRSFFYEEDGESKCELGARNINNYENRKELTKVGDTLIFEFTFRFTDEKKAIAEPCN